MLMVVFRIMVSQSMSLVNRRVVDADERLVESKLLEWLRFGVASWRGGKDWPLLECGGLNCGMFVEHGGRSDSLKGGVTLVRIRC
jgi:hypothetical protein